MRTSAAVIIALLLRRFGEGMGTLVKDASWSDQARRTTTP
jgi:hypothetical protein